MKLQTVRVIPGGSFQDGFVTCQKILWFVPLKLLLLTIIDVIRISLRMQSSYIESGASSAQWVGHKVIQFQILRKSFGVVCRRDVLMAEYDAGS